MFPAKIPASPISAPAPPPMTGPRHAHLEHAARDDAPGAPEDLLDLPGVERGGRRGGGAYHRSERSRGLGQRGAQTAREIERIAHPAVVHVGDVWSDAEQMVV